jgi:hypothetical protein
MAFCCNTRTKDHFVATRYDIKVEILVAAPIRLWACFDQKALDPDQALPESPEQRLCVQWTFWLVGALSTSPLPAHQDSRSLHLPSS